jgi:hypothetical protein
MGFKSWQWFPSYQKDQLSEGYAAIDRISVICGYTCSMMYR